jgi:hypothetical protein
VATVAGERRRAVGRARFGCSGWVGQNYRGGGAIWPI